jgi:sugar O-acyltransferase (sialic acid O-acetyltransferase NeuD family)
MSQIVIIGAGGFGREVAQLLRDLNASDSSFSLLGFVDEKGEVEKKLSAPLLGNDAWAISHLHPSVGIVLAVGNAALRARLALRYQEAGFSFPTLVHPSVRLGAEVSLGAGCILCAGTTLTTDIQVGQHVHVNLHCTVGHDAVLEDVVTLSPGVHLSGEVRIGRESELGTGSVVLPGVSLGPRSVLGAGAVAVRDLPGGETYVGIPARPLTSPRST